MFRMPSPAMIVALIALFVATTGTAVAGALITGANVKNNSLTGVDVLNGSLTTADVRNGTLVPADFKANTLPAGPQGQQGPQGPSGAPGANGAAGAQGLQGEPGVSGWARSFVISGPWNSAAKKTGEASCPPGKKLLSGGGRLHHLEALPPPIAIQESYAVDQDTWRLVGAETSPTAANWEPVVVIVCANVS